MRMYEEIDKETMGLLLGALAERTLFKRSRISVHCFCMEICEVLRYNFDVGRNE